MKASDWCKSLVMVCIIVLGCFVQGARANTVAEIANIINATIDLRADVSSNTVTVTRTRGATRDDNNFLTFGINSGVTVVWQASLQGNPNSNFALININGGSGTFRMESGTIANTGTGRAITNSSASTVNIMGGTVSSNGGTTIHNASTGALNISGGTISATTGNAINNASTGVITVSGSTTRITSARTDMSNRGTIHLENSGTATTARLVINGGTVENTSTQAQSVIVFTPAIRNMSAGAINISGGSVVNSGNSYTVSIYPPSSSSGSRINVSGGTVGTISNEGWSTHGSEVNISGGTVEMITSRVGSTVTISGNATVTNASSSATRGTVELEGGAMLNMTGGTVRNTAATNGNAIYMTQGTVNVSGGTVTTTSGHAIRTTTSSINNTINISGGTVSSSNSNGNAVSNQSGGSVRITGGTVSAPQTAVNTTNNVNITLGRSPIIEGRIWTHAMRFSVLRTGTDAFAPASGRVYTLGFPEYVASRIAVIDGLNFIQNFTLHSSSWALTPAGNDLAIAEARTVTFNLNGGPGTPPAPIGVAQGNTLHVKPLATGFTRTGYANDGNWYTTSAGTTEFRFGTNGTPVNENITLFLRWTPITYTITYDLNGGTNHASNPASYNITSSDITFQPPTRIGYTFDGWFNSNTGGSRITSITSGSTGNRTLWARWNVTITYNINNGTGTTPTTQTVSSGNSVAVPSGNELTRSGFTFAGWNTLANGTGVNYNAGSFFTATNEHTTLFARWNAAITYNLNGGAGTTPATQTVSAGSSVALQDGTGFWRNGFNFTRWNSNSTCTGTNYNAGASFTMTTGNTTLYACWDHAYTVTYNRNNGTGTAPNAQTVSIGSSVTLPSGSGLTRSGFVFGGWNINSSGTGTNYDIGSSFTPIDNITLYAKWIPIYIVTYSINNGTGAMPPRDTVIAGNSITLPSGSGLTRSGFTFGDWNTNANGTEINYDAGSSFTPNGNITLFARWYAVVTYNINGGTGTTPVSNTFNAGNSVMLPSGNEFTRVGFVFSGWNTNANGTGTNYNAGSSFAPSGNITLHARWVIIDAETPIISFFGGNRVVQVGGTLTLTALARINDGGTLSYQWYSNTTASTIGGTAIQGARSQSYSVPTSVVGTFYYYVIVTNTNNNAINNKITSATSNIATVLVGHFVLTANEFYERIEAYATATENVVIEVGEDFTLNQLVNIPTPAVTGRTLTIRSANPAVPVIIRRGTNRDLFTILNNATLVLENIIIDGTYNINPWDRGSLISVNGGGTFIMNNGAIVRNNESATFASSPFRCGGGVSVRNNGTFTMTGGEIKDNYVSSTIVGVGGGGVYVDGGTFTMTGGEISGNSASTDLGGGVYVDNGGTFNMIGGRISDNLGRDGGGVYVRATFIMSGGEISNNRGNRGYGAFVVGTGSIFTMTGGEIKGNRTLNPPIANDGGVHIFNFGTFTMNGGKISSNDGVGVLGSGISPEININGGVVFGVGSNLAAVIPGTYNFNAGASPAPNNAVVIAWNRPANTVTSVYATSSNTRLTTFPTGAATAVWAINDGKSGISYMNGANTGFVEIPNNMVAVTTDTHVSNFYGQIANYETAGGNVVVAVSQDITLSTLLSIPTPTTAGRTLTIRSVNPNAPITLTRGVSGNLFTVRDHATLILENIIIDGGHNNNFTDDGGGPLVQVNNGGILVMNNGAIVQNNRNNRFEFSRGGGVVVQAGGTFTMLGGEIRDNISPSGGGVFVNATVNEMGSFTMNGGKISGNTAGVVVNFGTFTMNGGTVIGTGTIVINAIGSGTHSLNANAPANGIIISWNKPTDTDPFFYVEGTNNGLTTSPTGTVTATWAIMNGKFGISYANGTNAGFTEIIDVTVKKQDDLDITAAKTIVEGATYTTAQANVANVNAARDTVAAIISRLSLNGVTAVVVNGTFTTAVAGTNTHATMNGTNGNYTFTVRLNKGTGVEQITKTLTLAITATPYDPTQDNIDIMAAKATVEGATYTVAQRNVVNVNAARDTVAAIIGRLPLSGVTAVVVNGTFTAAVAGTNSHATMNGTNGNYTFTVILNKGAGDEQVTNVLTLAITATPYDPMQDNADITAAKVIIEGATYKAVQANVVNVNAARDTVAAIIGRLSLNGVIAVVTSGNFTAAFSGTDGNFTFMVTLNKGAGTQQITDVLELVITATPIYTVTFMDGIGTGTVIGTPQTVEHGSNAIAPISPTRIGYMFNGWDVAFTNVTGDLTITAQWMINSYTVMFVGWNGTMIDEQTIEHGNAANEPNAPTSVSHNFTGWDIVFNNVTENLTVTAQWSIKTYTVTFIGWNGEVIGTPQTVKHGSAANEPNAPANVSHNFTGWNNEFNNVTENLTVTAQWSIKTYTVTFIGWNGEVIGTPQTVEHGSAANEPNAPTNVSHNFTGWNNEFNNVTENLTVTAQWSTKTYTVTFIGWDGEVIGTSQTVEHGNAANEPNAPTSISYNFTGWNNNFDNVTENLTVTAQWSIKTYTVTFIGWNGEVIGTPQTVEHGSTANQPNAPTSVSHNFTDWDNGFDNVTSDLTVAAQWSIKTYTVTFIGRDSEVVDEQIVEHGSAANQPNTPTNASHNFTGWDNDFDNVTNDLIVTAQWTINSYTVTFVSGTGIMLKTENVNYGSSATAPFNPTRTGYSFTGWDIAFTNVTSNLTVTAQWTIIINQDNIDITAAKATIESVTFGPVAQSILNSQGMARGFVEDVITELNLNGVAAVVTAVGFRAAFNGTDGSYTFRITLNKGIGTQQMTNILELVISATPVSVLSPERVIPNPQQPNKDEFVEITVLAGEFTAGPNPVARSASSVTFFRQGKWVQSAMLTIFDASGNVINKIRITDNALNTQERREVGSWDLKDSKGRSVAEGTYLIRGVVTTSDGKKERVSVMLGVR